MKNPNPTSRITAVLAAAFLSVLNVPAAVITWNNAAGGNWSVSGNWSPASVPGTVDDVRFGNTGTGAINTNDITSEVINSLILNHNNTALNSTVINAGTTVSINGAGAAGSVLFATDSGTSGAFAVPASISGGGTLSLSGAGNIVVRQCNTANGAQMATLDMSGLDNFTATAGRLLIGQANASPDLNRPSGTLILAKTNNITLTGGAPQVMVQDATVNANGSVASVLTFGQVNVLNAATWRLGGQKGVANVQFNGSLTSPSLKIRGADGISPSTVIDVGYNSASSTGNNMASTVNLGSGTVDIMANLINVPQGPTGTGTGTSTGTLTVGDGVVNAATIEVGYGIATGASGVTTGTLNVNNNGISAGGAVIQASTLRLARTNGGSATVTGTLNINGGAVQAGTIVAGGGVSTINLNNGKLVVTNTAGTLAAPIRNFSIADSTLQLPALNGGATVAINNLTVSGTANTINISSIPPIGSYPATFTLLRYQTGVGGNFVLGTLPAGSPSYAGSILDLGNGVVQLRLTAGPISDLGLLWKGNLSGDWDSSNLNWLFHGNPTNFFIGAVPTFDDSAAQFTVNLTEALLPGGVIVSNTTTPYSFIGSGSVSAGLLTKKGAANLTLENVGDNTFVTAVIESGTVQLGTGGVDGSLTAINITNNGALIVNRDGNLSLGAAISGTGSLTKIGPGALTLSGASSYSGITVLAVGTLQIDGGSGSGALSTSNGTVLAGSGSINGPATVRGELNPGPLNGPGVFKAHGGLTLASGAALTFNLSATDPSNPAANDGVEVVGNLALNNNVITVNIAGTPQQGASYLLFTYTGSLSGSFNPTVAGTHFAAAIDTTTPGAVYLNITGSGGADLRWASTADDAWNLTTANWVTLSSIVPSVFSAGDTTLLDDSNTVVTTLTIPSGLTVYPAIVTANATNNNYVINGPGRIGGSASLVKSGGGLLAVNTPNNFTGPVEVQAGTLQTGNGSALGTATAGTTVQSGATLDLNGQNLGGEIITISGAGNNGVGALVNNGPGQAQALRQITLAGDATIGGTGLLGVNNGGGGASLSSGGMPYTLTKVGPNQLTLQNVAALDPGLGNIHIQEGTIEFSALTVGMGDPAYTNLVEAGATLSVAANSVAWNKYFLFNGNGTTTTFNNGASASTELAGSVELQGDCVFNAGGTLLTVSGVIAGDGGLIKNGGSPMVLTAANTYKGDTRINTAALRLNGTASIANSSNIIINAGATLTVTGRVDSTFTLITSQTLKGNGTINGHVIEGAGSIIAPGMDAIGALNVSNTITLGGSTVMELDQANGTNDMLRCNGSITYGGTLNLVNLGNPLPAGASFKLFNASSYLGSFGSINPPTPGPGQTWNTSALNTSGTISVVGSPASLKFSNVVLSGNNLTLSGSNGVPFATYYVRASDNVGLTLASWPRVATNSFSTSGSFSFTTNMVPSIPIRFFAIEQP